MTPLTIYKKKKNACINIQQWRNWLHEKELELEETNDENETRAMKEEWLERERTLTDTEKVRIRRRIRILRF